MFDGDRLEAKDEASAYFIKCASGYSSAWSCSVSHLYADPISSSLLLAVARPPTRDMRNFRDYRVSHSRTSNQVGMDHGL